MELTMREANRLWRLGKPIYCQAMNGKRYPIVSWGYAYITYLTPDGRRIRVVNGILPVYESSTVD